MRAVCVLTKSVFITKTYYNLHVHMLNIHATFTAQQTSTRSPFEKFYNSSFFIKRVLELP